jgi:hypothetical protein
MFSSFNMWLFCSHFSIQNHAFARLVQADVSIPLFIFWGPSRYFINLTRESHVQSFLELDVFGFLISLEGIPI